MKFLIRTDALPNIGTGHLMRCIALGQMLKEKNQGVIFVTKTENKYLLAKLEKEKFDYKLLQEDAALDNDAAQTLQIAGEINAKWIITDGYKFVTEYQERIKSEGFKLMCIDDIAGCHYVSDIVLNQNLDSEKYLNYSCEKYTKLLLGVKFLLFRREFRELNNWKRKHNRDIQKILITLGGSDPENYTFRIVEFIDMYKDKRFELNVIVGADYKYIEQLKKFSESSFHKIKIFRNIDNMSDVIRTNDFVISAGGSTVWELAFLETPMLLGVSAENQLMIVEKMNENNCAVNIGWFKNLQQETFLSDFADLMDNYDKRKKIGRNAKEILRYYSADNILTELGI